MARGNFTGNISYGTDDSKMPFIREGVTKSGTSYKSLRLSVSPEKNNRAFCEMFGMKGGTINAFTTDGESTQIEWDDRFDEDVIKSIRGAHIVNLTGEPEDRKVFLAEWDMINYLDENKELLKEGKFTVTVRPQKDFYNGNVRDRFTIQNIYAASDDAKPGLKLFDVLYYDKEGIDVSDFATEKKIYINGYISTFVNKNELGTDKGANKYIAQQAVLDCSRLDFENEKHMKVLKVKLLCLGLKYEDGKVKVALKNKNYHKQNIEFVYINGSEKEEFGVDMLTDFQRELYESGVKSLEEFRPANGGDVFGKSITVWKITSFDARGEYADGIVDTEEKGEEFEDNIYTPVARESADEVIEKASTKKKVVEEDEDDDEDVEDLFS